jgi:HK97 family phage major capsid protein
VPEEMWQGIVDAQKMYNALRQTRAEVMTTSDGRDMPIPTANDTSNSGELLSENSQATEQDITFGSKNLVAYMFSSKIIRVSMQLLQDSAIDIEAYLQAKLAERVGRVTADYFTTGSGSGQPEGIITGATVGKTASGTSAITYDEILDLVHAVDPAYRMNAEFQFNDEVLKALKQLKDSENRPLWLPGTQMREPDTINGYPYSVNQNMAGLSANNKTVAFGDFSNYKIRDVQGGMVLRLTERYADYAQVGFIGFFRHGGILADAGTNPVQVLQQSA